MVNRQQVDVLGKGPEEWNRWRAIHSNVPIDLSGANLSDARLRGANFTKADLTYANIFGADLTGAIIRSADLHRANLSGSTLKDADLSGSLLRQTTLGDVDLSSVIGLDRVHHSGPSTIGIDTIYKSSGNIPEIFLRGAGVPESFITYAHSLAAKPIDFYSCFISYSSKDQEFATRLHNDLQAAGVRCWFAPEDLKIGDKFRSKIDESIKLFDKLLLILSKRSIASPWVEEEVEAAYEKERRGPRKTVLFPIRIDAAVEHTIAPWAANLRRTRHIGEFAGWRARIRLTEAMGSATPNRRPGDVYASFEIKAVPLTIAAEAVSL